MKNFKIYMILAIIFLAHVTLLDHISFAGAKPDLILISVIFFGLFFGERTGFSLGLAAGLLEDTLSFGYLGINAFVLCLTGLTAGVIGSKISKESKMAQALVVLCLSIISMLLHMTVINCVSFGPYPQASDYLARFVIPSSAYTALISIPFMAKLIELFHLRQERDYL